MSEQPTGQRTPDTLDDRLGRWIGIARSRAYGAMTDGDWAALEIVLLQARIHARAAANLAPDAARYQYVRQELSPEDFATVPTEELDDFIDEAIARHQELSNQIAAETDSIGE